ncbi:CDP-diacylglycerol--serine O-phosphatidyltransferase [Wolinella succinogenes]|uniref:CDP-diacylglycerol--serine O-phosphatidyltransferase n=1 Tax=Wolinella succinogenes TaxID=844 RepID=UPI00240A99A0|nr:CDP-diacylglycerol--serine O-phosphatidyltransferase [Wolinella succinogenes]
MKINPLYILPNLFTGASVYLGILSMAYAFKGRFELACWLIMLAMIFDGLDGRVARLTGTTSKFGIEFDSLADVVAFGVAPAMVLYFYLGQYFGKFGIMVSGLYVVFGAIRLARFNVSTSNAEPNVFIGLPIPSAAVFVVSWILMQINYSMFDRFGYMILAMTLGVAILMVSNVRYPSFKKMDKSEVNFKKAIVLLMMLLALVYLYPIEGITILITSYILFGLGRALYFFFKFKIRHHGDGTAS